MTSNCEQFLSTEFDVDLLINACKHLLALDDNLDQDTNAEISLRCVTPFDLNQ